MAFEQRKAIKTSSPAVCALCRGRASQVLQNPGVYGIVSKEWQEAVEGIYLWRGEARGRVRGKLQGAISAEKWE